MKITLRNHLKHLFVITLTTITVVFALKYILRGEGWVLYDYLIYNSIFILILVVPTIVLHVNYYLKNHNMQLYEDSNSIILEVDEGRIELSKTTIKRVDYYVSFAKFEKRTPWLPWDEYHHVIIHLENGEQIIITSLLLENLDFFTNNEWETIIHKGLYRFAREVEEKNNS